jgi:hypothetical protein
MTVIKGKYKDWFDRITRPGDVLRELVEKAPSMLMRAYFKRSRAAAIRVKCYDCMGGFRPSLVDACTVVACPLWGYRKGRSWQDPMEFSATSVADFNYEVDDADLEESSEASGVEGAEDEFDYGDEDE